MCVCLCIKKVLNHKIKHYTGKIERKTQKENNGKKKGSERSEVKK